MPNLSKRTIFWQSLRILLFARITSSVRKHLLKLSPQLTAGSKILVVLALFLGAVVYQILNTLFNKVLTYIYPVKPLNAFDEFFLYESSESTSNIALAIKLKKNK